MRPRIQPLLIKRLSLEGDGVGQPSGSTKTAFVPYTLPDEVAEGKILFDKKNFSRYLPLSFQQTSTDRVTPRCPHHFLPGSKRWCGGCDWQHIQFNRQEKEKRKLVIETLERIGKIPSPPVEETQSSPSQWKYRNKVQIPFGRHNKRIVSGFYHPGSHDVVDINECQVQSDVSFEIFKVVRELVKKFNWQTYNEDRHQGWLRHLLIRTNQKGEALVTLVTNGSQFPNKRDYVSAIRRAFPSIIGLHQNIQKARTNVILGRHWARLWGADWIEEKMNDLIFTSGPGSFFQINTGSAERLYDLVIKKAGLTKKSILVDLFCGVGCLTLIGAKKAHFAIGVEWSASSIRDANRNASLNHIRNVDFIEAKAEEGLKHPSVSWVKEEVKNLVVLVDPPRSGCQPTLIQQLIHWRAPRLIYVSCNPATLARDLQLLKKVYRPVTVTPVDLFPQTSHIETVTQLELNNN